MRLFTGLFALFLALWANLVHADRVIPSDRVTTGLIVRDAPGGDRLGALLPGESATLVGDVPRWFEVRLGDGTQGFVSKGWSVVIPDPEQPPALLRLGSWNVQKLGHGSSKNFGLVAQVIDANFDIVAVVEVMQKGGGHPGYDQLMTTLGSGWAGVVTDSPRPDTGAGHAEFYAVLYRPARVQLCAGWTGLTFFVDNTGAPGDTRPDLFSREPAFGCFKASDEFDFMLAPYHAVWEPSRKEIIQAEVRQLDSVFAAMAEARPGERDLLIVGDFNLVPTKMAEVINMQVTTLGDGSTLHNGERTDNLYDYVLVFSATDTNELIGEPEVLDVRGVASSPRVFHQTVSDHLPVVARFRAGGDDD